jgi:hypothetical protein
MKKLVLMFVAFAAISFASCGDKATPAQNADTATVDTVQVDTTAQDTAAAQDTATVK